jgi:hypothetical protein
MSRCTLALVLIGLITAPLAAQDFHTKSGLLLGIYASPGSGGMRVSDTIPGYSAEGRLFPGDVLLRTTVDGVQIYRLRTHFEMENAKIAIGPNREAAVELWRPGVGLIYAWVEFTPVGGPSVYSIQQPCKAQFKMEHEKPGARQLFQGNGSLLPGAGVGSGVIPQPLPQPVPLPPQGPGAGVDPGSLFGR